MALTVTNNVAPFNGQNNLTRTNNTSPKAIERPTPDVKINQTPKGQGNAPERPAPDVKINFSAKGQEAALQQAAAQVKTSDKTKAPEAKPTQPAPQVKVSAATKGAEAKPTPPVPNAKGNQRAGTPVAQTPSQKQQTRIELQSAISDTRKAVKQVKAGEGALNEIQDILLKVRERVQDIAKNGTTDKDKQALNQKEIAKALKSIDQIANSAQRTLKKPADKSAGKVDSKPPEGVKPLPPNNDKKPVPVEVKTTPVAPTVPTKGKTPTEVKVLPITPVTKADAVKPAPQTEPGKPPVKVKDAPKPAPQTEPSKSPTKVKDSPTALKTKVEANKAASSTASKTATASATPPDIATQDVTSNSQATSNQAAETKASQKAAQGTKPSSSLSPNFGQIVLDKRGIVDSGDKQPPAVALTNLQPAVAAPAKAFEVQQSAFTIDATNSRSSNEPLDEESEKIEEDSGTKKFSLRFQGGVNEDEIANLILDQIHDEVNLVSRLSTINVSDQASAQDSLQVIEKVIRDTASLRSQLGAFQADALANNADNLRANLAHLVSAEATIRDTDFAIEVAAFTKAQVRLQGGSAALGNANQIPQLVADLLRG